MIEYTDLLKIYSSSYYWLYADEILESEWGNVSIAQEYLKKYWLPQKEYETIWKSIQDSIFINQHTSLPEMLFQEEYSLMPFLGGCLFTQDDFEQLQKCMLAIGDDYFVVIQNTFVKELKIQPFRMKFPTTITWQELMSGNFISTMLFEAFINEFFVFGTTEAWGEYAANDSIDTLNIVGFKSEYAPIFHRYMYMPKEDLPEVEKSLPAEYIDRSTIRVKLNA